jgi:hypothetical protein
VRLSPLLFCFGWREEEVGLNMDKGKERTHIWFRGLLSIPFIKEVSSEKLAIQGSFGNSGW